MSHTICLFLSFINLPMPKFPKFSTVLQGVSTQTTAGQKGDPGATRRGRSTNKRFLCVTTNHNVTQAADANLRTSQSTFVAPFSHNNCYRSIVGAQPLGLVGLGSTDC